MTSRFPFVAAWLLLGSGCLGSAVTTGGGKHDGGTAGNTNDVVDLAVDAQAEFDAKVLPLLTQDCGSCHAQAGGSFPPFLVAATSGTVYDTFIAWPNLVGVTPETSEILTKPTHEGPSYADGTSDAIKTHVAAISQWIVDYNAVRATASQGDMGMLALTAPASPSMGVVNTVALDSLGSSFQGMTITYTPSLVGTTAIKLTDVRLNATASAGLTVTGTVLAFYNSTDLENTQSIDTDFNQGSFTAYEGGTALVGTTITPYSAGQYIAFSFASIVPTAGAAPDLGSATPACKDLTHFAAFKQDLLGMNAMNLNCNSCHKPGGNGNSAFNMSGFTDATMDAASCATMLNYVTIASPSTSDVYMKIDGGKTHQGGTLTSANQQTFLAALTTWLSGEQ